MAGVHIKVFGGITPAIDATLLPPDGAVRAENVDLKDGKLRAVKDGSTVATPTKTGTKRTIYRFGQNLTVDSQYWFTWVDDVDVVKLPIDADTAERTIFTGDTVLGYPAQTDNNLALTGGTNYPVAARRLGLPAPDVGGMNVAVTGTPTDAVNDPVEGVAYVLTYVNDWGEESAPSAATAVYTWQPGQTIEITSIPAAPTGAYNVTKKRLYRTASGNQGTAYQFLVELGVATASYNDTTPTEALGELIETWGWEQLPAGAKGMTLMANGIGLAFLENTVYVSVPNALYAYPPEYRLSVDSPIVALCAFGQSAFVGTKSFPYVINGVAPDMMAATKLDVNQACVAKRSVVPMMGGVVYASPDGLYHVSAGGLQPLTDKLFTRDQWQAYKPSSFHAYEIDGRYVAFYDTGSVAGSLVFDFATAKVTTSTVTCTAAYNDPQQDALYVAQSTTIKKLGAGSVLAKTWRSRTFTSPTELNFAYARVVADAYASVTFKLIDAVTGSTVHTKVVTGSAPFRLPPNNLHEFQIEVSGTSDVRSVSLAETGEEIESMT